MAMKPGLLPTGPDGDDDDEDAADLVEPVPADWPRPLELDVQDLLRL